MQQAQGSLRGLALFDGFGFSSLGLSFLREGSEKKGFAGTGKTGKASGERALPEVRFDSGEGGGTGVYPRESGGSSFRFYRYVLHERAEDYERLGWCLADDMQGHPVVGERAVMMQWICPCRLVEPQ